MSHNPKHTFITTLAAAFIALTSLLAAPVVAPAQSAQAAPYVSTLLYHQSGCHAWHSCPSDHGTYVCGDTGHGCNFAASGTRIAAPPSKQSVSKAAPVHAAVAASAAAKTVTVRTGAVCRDGTHSAATGSGACSAHKGVARWLYKTVKR